MGQRTGRWVKGKHLSHNRAGVGEIEAPERRYLLQPCLPSIWYFQMPAMPISLTFSAILFYIHLYHKRKLQLSLNIQKQLFFNYVVFLNDQNKKTNRKYLQHITNNELQYLILDPKNSTYQHHPSRNRLI